MKKEIIICFIILILLFIMGILFSRSKFKFYEDEEKVNTTNITTEVTTTINKSKYVSYNGNLNIINNKLVNQYGEVFQLKGISSHGIQWYKDLVTKENLDIIKSWGANAFRIAMYTEENGYLSNKSLKDDVKRIVDMVIDEDMYVIIDWHILSNGNPLSTLDDAKEFFDEMSKIYASTPNVIYEVCNEPNNTSWINNIKPYAEEVIKTIRVNSSSSIIIVGTNTWSQDVEDAMNNPINDNLTMYALHFYSGTHTEWLRTRADSVLNKIPLFVSEWGTSDASGNGGNYYDEANKWINWMNENNISFINWSLSNKNESSALLKENCTKLTDECLTEDGKYIKNIINS